MAKHQGFTLIEVVAALAIMGLSLVVLFRAGGTGIAGTAAAGLHIEATQRAQSRLDAAGIMEKLRPGIAAGTDAEGYSWRLAVTRLASHPAPVSLSLYQVEVTVTPPGGKHRAVTLTTRRIGEDHDE